MLPQYLYEKLKALNIELQSVGDMTFLYYNSECIASVSDTNSDYFAGFISGFLSGWNRTR